MRKTSSHGSPIPSSSRQGSLGPQSPLRIIPSTTQYEWGGSPVYPPPPAPAPAPYDPTVTIPIDSYRPNYSQDAYPPPPPPPQDFYNNTRNNNHSNGNHNGGGYNSYGGGQRGGGHMYGNDRPPYYDDFPPPGGNNHYGPPPVSNFPQEHNNYGPRPPIVTIDLPLAITYHTKISLSAINVLPPYFLNLELLPQINLATLPYSIETAANQPPTVPGRRRRVFICPDLSPSAEPYNTARRIIGEDVEWREVPDLRSIERILEDENKRWGIWLQREREEEERRKEEVRIRIEREVREEKELRDKLLLSVANSGNGKGAKMVNAGLEAEAGEIPILEQPEGPESPIVSGTVPSHSEDLSARLASLVESGIVKSNGQNTPARSEQGEEGSSIREGSEPMSASGGLAGRKRARFEDEEALVDAVDFESKRSPDRKLLDVLCKRPRRDLEDWALKHGVVVDEQTTLVNKEPNLGEQDSITGVWKIAGESLNSEIVPQIQILMARALRDSAVAPRLRLYQSSAVTQTLEENVPWFAALIKENEERLDLLLEEKK